MGLANRDKGLKKLCRAIQPLGIGHEPYWIKYINNGLKQYSI